jgi:hypothetical protein
MYVLFFCSRSKRETAKFYNFTISPYELENFVQFVHRFLSKFNFWLLFFREDISWIIVFVCFFLGGGVACCIVKVYNTCVHIQEIV